jgi:hypothetical protein
MIPGSCKCRVDTGDAVGGISSVMFGCSIDLSILEESSSLAKYVKGFVF